MHHHRAEDAPPYFVMIITGHIAIGGILYLERAYAPPMWLELAIWLPFVAIASLLLLPRVKGSLVGLQWAFRMHGFDDETSEPFRKKQVTAPSSPGSAS